MNIQLLEQVEEFVRNNPERIDLNHYATLGGKVCVGGALMLVSGYNPVVSSHGLLGWRKKNKSLFRRIVPISLDPLISSSWETICGLLGCKMGKSDFMVTAQLVDMYSGQIPHAEVALARILMVKRYNSGEIDGKEFLIKMDNYYQRGNMPVNEEDEFQPESA